MAEESLGLDQILREEREAIRQATDPPRPLSALCISGGGIRSATFGLGAIQSLAEHGLLAQFDYLSTVSGGGYIGSWLTAWATRAGGIGNVVPQLLEDAPRPAEGKPDPIQHLREYNNYLTPRLGEFSDDTWTLIATVVRNIALNWLVLIPLLLCFLMAPRLLLSLGMLAQDYELRTGQVGQTAAAVLASFCSLLFGVALFNIMRYLPGVGGVDHTRSDYIRFVLIPMAGSTLLYCAYDAKIPTHNAELWPLVLWNLIIAGFTWILYLIFAAKEPWGRRWSLFRRLLGAVVLLALCLGAAEWVVSNKLAGADTLWQVYVTYVPPLLGFSFCAALALFAGLSGQTLEDRDREWMSRASAGLMMFYAAWLAACLLVLIVPQWLFGWEAWGAGAIGTAAGWVTARLGKQQSTGKWGSAALKLAPTLFILAVAVGLTVGTNMLLYGLNALYSQVRPQPVVNWWDHRNLLEHSGVVDVTFATLLFLGMAMFMARYININRFSLHAMYRDRLTRAYPGASNPDRAAAATPGKTVDGGLNRFTGFAESDNLLLHKLTRKPFHVLNLTLNVVHSERLAWQQRKAQPFSATPLHCGNYQLGYRRSDEYAGGISLGTAVSISGAAASPSMGEKTSAKLGFIMTLLNARLGAWLGNPGQAGDKTWKHLGPKSAIKSLLREALGLTNSDSQYVYLSDGGHFENLALYEMVLRRCRSIVLLDSGCDPNFTFEDLGNALRKIRIDLNVPITFEGDSFEAVRDRKRRYALGKIEYSKDETGYLIYIKPMVLGGEPPDVASYVKANPSFPHQSTANQWFSESQTESYRMLGKISVDSICRNWRADQPVADLGEHVRRIQTEKALAAAAANA